MFIVTPSIYSADLLDMKNVLEGCREFAHLHADIDDGNFVRGISFGMDYLKAVTEHTQVPIDVHLEVCNPMDYVKPLAQMGITRAAAHIEALPYPSLFLSTARNLGMKAGLAVNVKTPVSEVYPYASEIDELILLTSEADDDGLLFREGVLEKAVQIRERMRPEAWLLVDGGVSEDNLEQILRAGANGVAVGRAVFGDSNPGEAYRRILQAGQRWRKTLFGD